MSVKRKKGTTARNKRQLLEVEYESSENLKCISSFQEMGLNEKLLQRIDMFGFKKPSIIQQKAIVPIIKGRDVIAQSQSGTGKTATFVIASLQRLNTTVERTQVLCMVPTRELTIQIHSIFRELGGPMNAKCFGGFAYKNNKNQINFNQYHVVVATPEMVVNMIDNGFETNHIQILILDEADLMLNKSMKVQVYKVYRELPTVQVILISATVTDEFMHNSNQLMTAPIRIFVKKADLKLKVIKQYYVIVNNEDKMSILYELYRVLTITQSIIFCNSDKVVENVASNMEELGFDVVSVHSRTFEFERDDIYKSFQKGNDRILVTNDIWARGIDVHNVSLVVNYDFPSDCELYIHRIGRAGRFDREGTVINILRKTQWGIKEKIEQCYNIKMDALPENFGLI